MTGTTTDRLGRALRDLRISVTDRCNLRCRYCMPREVFGPDHAFLPRAELLSFEEITTLVRAFARAGVTKLRLTGGEPLLRHDLPRLIDMVASVPGIDDVALTTNGSLLAAQAQALRDAGLKRVTVSLDSLDPEVFAALADTKIPLATVLEGIEAAVAAGFSPIKLNAVVKKGVSDDVVPLAEFARQGGHVMRFIEYMDVGASNGWRLDDVVPGAEILRRIDAVWPLEPVAPARPGEVAKRWRYRDGGGEIGVITSITAPFCGDCTRARISAVGELFTCLFATRGRDLRAVLRGEYTGAALDAALDDAITGNWARRTDRYSELRTAATPGAGNAGRGDTGHGGRVEMSYIGG